MTNKRYFFDLIENFFKTERNESFNRIADFFQTDEKQEKDENYIEKVESYVVNNVETTVTTYFDSEGYAVASVAKSVRVKSKESKLQDQLNAALEKEDYIKAAEIKKEIDQLQTKK